MFLVACKENNKNIEGIWNVDSKFYSATYKIHNEKGDMAAQVLYYNDGTTQYKFPNKDDKKMFLFKNLRKKERKCLC